MKRGARLVCATVLACALVPAASAHALTTYVDYDSVVISAGPGEPNILRVMPDPAPPAGAGASFLILDLGANPIPGRGCARVTRQSVRCSTSYDNPLPSLSLGLGDRDDRATIQGGFYYAQATGGGGRDHMDLGGVSSMFGWLSGGPGADVITGAVAGFDTIMGDEGNDEIHADDGFADDIDCGAGTDTTRTDYADSTSNCEG